jgi:hypothetical protein
VQIIDVDVTLGASPVFLNDASFTALAGQDKFTRVRVVPKSSNTHVVNVTGPNNVLLKQIAKPSAVDAIQDEFDLSVSGTRNELHLASIALSGTPGEHALASIYIQ